MVLYLQPRLLLVLALGFFSGLPLALTGATLTAWLADSGVNMAAIGLFAAVATPYAFKFLWAPLMDRLPLPVLSRLGRRRSWLLLSQLLVVAAMLAMAATDPARAPFSTALVAVLLATASASQDIVIDAYRVELLTPEQQGAGGAMIIFGYRIGMLASGAGALYLAQMFGWAATYTIMAAIMAAGLLLTLGMRETSPREESAAPRGLRAFLRQAVLMPLADFATRPHWFLVLCFIVLYKLGDAFLGVMFNPFLLAIGFSKLQIAEIAKIYGFAATMLGVFAGGWVVSRMGTYRALMLSGLVHILTNLLLIEQARRGADVHFLIFSIASENFTGGIASAAFIAYLSALCSRHYTATQYALVSSLAAFGRTWLSTPSGLVAQSFGWQIFFAFSAAIALPSLVLLWWLERAQKRA